MTRMTVLRVALSVVVVALLGSCELIANIPDRTEVTEPCQVFCQLANELCTGEFAIYKPLECPAACALFTTEERECRQEELKLLERAGDREAYLYCANVSLSGGQKECGGNPCKNYCNTMSKVCSDYGEMGVTYPESDGTNSDSCEKMCSVIPDKENMNRGRGTSTYDVIADHEGDTVQCRFVHLTLAAQNDAFAKAHCPHAFISPKPLGGEVPWCGSPKQDGVPTCKDYCDIIMRACVDNGTAEHRVYKDKAQCEAACGAFPLGTLDVYANENTVTCRKYHSYNAAVLDDQATHCPHAGPGGATVCGNDCDGFCTLVEKGCSAEYESQYGSRRNCLSSCEAAQKEDPTYKDGGMKYYSVAKAKQGNNWACRLYNAADANVNPDDAQDTCARAVGTASCPAF